LIAETRADGMKKRMLTVIFAVFVSFPAPSANTDDPGGWTKAKWGMTVPQVISAFQGSKNRLIPIRAVDGPTMDGLLAIDGCVDLQIPKTFGDEPPRCFHVWFGFTKTSPATLIHVDLKPDPPSSNYMWAFISLRDMLIDKYGLSAYEKKSEQGALLYSDEIVWKFPTSRIRLSIMGPNSRPDNAELSLQYFKAPNADNL
jgi:hypothetical protein